MNNFSCPGAFRTRIALQNCALHKCIPVLISFALLFFHHDVIAQTYQSRFNNQSPLDFSLSFSRYDLDLESSNANSPMKQTRISINLLNEISPNLDIGLIIGSNFLSQNNDTATTGISLNGNHIGFVLNGTVGNKLQLGLHALAIYQEASGENALRHVSLTWFEWLAETTLRLALGPQLAIIAGVGLTGLDADRHISGDINETARLNFETHSQGKLAIEILSTPDDRIRLTLNRGSYDGLHLSFAHVF